MSISTVNGVDLERLNATIEAVTADPGLGRFQFRARNHWVDGGHSRTTIQGFYGAGQEDTTRAQPFLVDSDEPPVLLGENRAPNAGEFALQALAACLAGTVVYHAAARGMALQGLECTVEGDLDVQGFLGLDRNVRPGYEQDPGQHQGHRRVRRRADRRAGRPDPLLARAGHDHQPGRRDHRRRTSVR